jgi:CDP-glucose 4,6-dehydratase
MTQAVQQIASGSDWKGVKVLVTGASGFKGSWLCQVLLSLGAEVYGTVRNRYHPLSAYGVLGLDKKITKVAADLAHCEEMFDVINSVGPEVIFHLGARSQVPVALRDPKRTYEINVMGTINILEACRRFGVVKKLLVVSTDHVFGSVEGDQLPKGGFAETSPTSYAGPYGTSKSIMESCVRSYGRTYGEDMPAMGLTRSANVYGYGDVAYRRVIPVFIKSALEKGEVPLTVRRNGRQFIHVTDVIEGYIRAASSLVKNGATDDTATPTYHFAAQAYESYAEPGENFIRIGSLANLVSHIFDVPVVEKEGCRDYAVHENAVQALSCDMTHQHLGWKPRRAMREGVDAVADWYRGEQTITDPDELHEHHARLVMSDIAKIVTGLGPVKPTSMTEEKSTLTVAAGRSDSRRGFAADAPIFRTE